MQRGDGEEQCRNREWLSGWDNGNIGRGKCQWQWWGQREYFILYLFIRLFIHSFIYLIEPDGVRGSDQARAALPSLGNPIREALDQALSKMKDVMISQKAPPDLAELS
jgi:hypothetical protein